MLTTTVEVSTNHSPGTPSTHILTPEPHTSALTLEPSPLQKAIEKQNCTAVFDWLAGASEGSTHAGLKPGL